MAADRVILTVPARSEYAKTVRMTAAELASRIGMSYDDVDDVRMAAEEAFVFASSRVGDGDDITFAIAIDSTGLAMSVGPLPLRTEESATDESLDRYAAFILESVCDEFEIIESAEGCTLNLVKRSATAGE